MAKTLEFIILAMGFVGCVQLIYLSIYTFNKQVLNEWSCRSLCVFELVETVLINNFLMVLVQVSEYAEHNDAILLVIVPAAQAPEIASSRALRVAKEFDGDGKLLLCF